MTRTFFALFLTLSLSFTAMAQEADTGETNASGNANPGTDATTVDREALSHPYNLPNGYAAVTANHALTADQADRALTADLADTATLAETADYATLAAEAELAETATNAQLLAGLGSDFYRNASNFLNGTLALDRLVGTVLTTDHKIVSERLSGGTYDINITGHANTATRADEARRAQSAVVCTGGASGCDF